MAGGAASITMQRGYNLGTYYYQELRGSGAYLLSSVLPSWKQYMTCDHPHASLLTSSPSAVHAAR